MRIAHTQAMHDALAHAGCTKLLAALRKGYLAAGGRWN
jgi:hypothetical protein